jgi:hypothetical protein
MQNISKLYQYNNFLDFEPSELECPLKYLKFNAEINESHKIKYLSSKYKMIKRFQNFLITDINYQLFIKRIIYNI